MSLDFFVTIWSYNAIRNVLSGGGGKAGDKVTVEFNGVVKSTVVDEHGKWTLNLGPFAAGGPFEMKITQGIASVTIKNIMIGEVWICSGQSNMQWGTERNQQRRGNCQCKLSRHSFHNNPKISRLSPVLDFLRLIGLARVLASDGR